jgi:hypothetical protein
MISLVMAAFLAVVASTRPAHAGSASFEILIDTSGLGQGPGGLVDINLGVSFPPGSPSVSVQVFGPITDGTLGAANTISGTATGDLTTPGGVTANNTQSTNELSQDFSVGSFFDVFVTLSGPEIGAGAVGPWSGTVFNLSVFDAPGKFEGATLTANPNVDQGGMPIVDGTIGIDVTSEAVQVIPLSVPEPSSLVLLGLGAAAVVVAGRLRKPAAA